VVGEPPKDRVAEVAERIRSAEQRRDDGAEEQDGAAEPHPPSRVRFGWKRRRFP